MATIRTIRNYYYLDFYDESGKRHRKSLGLKASKKNRKKALLEKKKIEYELEAGVYKERQKRIENRNKLLNQGFDEFITSRKEPSIETVKDYTFAFKKILDHFGNIPINKVTTDGIADLENELRKKVSENSIASYFKKLKVIFNYFNSAGLIKINPIPTYQMRIEEPLTIPRKDLEEILLKLKHRNRKHYRVVALLLLTGLRISELILLNFDDIDFRENIILIRNGKGHRDDRFPLYEDLREFLIKEYPKKEGRLFDYKNRNSMKFFYKFLKAEGYPAYNFHSLRKTFISKLINSGMSVYDVMTLARHKSIKTTLKHYTTAELSRMGKEISERSNLGTIVGTTKNKSLKKIEFVGKTNEAT